jgi:hypothetical protein
VAVSKSLAWYASTPEVPSARAAVRVASSGWATAEVPSRRRRPAMGTARRLADIRRGFWGQREALTRLELQVDQDPSGGVFG